MKRRHKTILVQREMSRAGTIIRIVLIRVAAVVLLATLVLFLLWNEIEARTRSGIAILAAGQLIHGTSPAQSRNSLEAVTNDATSLADQFTAVIATSPTPAATTVQLSSGPGTPRLSIHSLSSSPPLLAPSQSPVTPTMVPIAVFSGYDATSNAKFDGSTTGVVSSGPATAAPSEPWDTLWHSPTGPVDPQYHSIIRGIVGSVAVWPGLCESWAHLAKRFFARPLVQDKQEWDKGWMLLLQAIMRRRIKDWFGDAGRHGGDFVPNAQTLLSRLHRARAKRDCRRRVQGGQCVLGVHDVVP